MGNSLFRRAVGRLDLLRLGKERCARMRGVAIGDGYRILSHLDASEPWLISIGDRVTISVNCTLVTHDGAACLVRDDRGRLCRYAPVTVGSDVLIGAGSVVTADVPSSTVVAGVSTRPISAWDAFTEKVLTWPSESDKHGANYRERVDSIVMH